MICLDFKTKIPSMQQKRTNKEKEFTKAVSEVIKKIRSQNNKTLNTMAFDCGIAPSTLSRIENNQNTPTIANLHKISEGCNIKFSEFISNIEKELPADFSFIDI